MKTNKEKFIFLGLAVIVIIFLAVFASYKDKTNQIDSETKDNYQPDGLISDEKLDENQKNNGQESAGLKSFNKAEYDRIMLLGSNAYNQQKYEEAIDYYKQALKIEELDVVYGKLYSVYMSMKDYKNALIVLDKARTLNPSFNQYWFWTIEIKRSIYNVDYSELEKIYQEGFGKVELTAQVNLVTFFARVSEEMNKYNESIILWGKAIDLNPKKKEIYQAEIDRLKALLN